MIRSVGVETVRMTTLRDVMSRALTSLPDREIVLKLNVEGAVGDIILALAPSELEPVVEVHLDHEPDSPYALNDVLEHLSQAGLDELDDRGTVRILRIRRSTGIDAASPTSDGAV
jgi:hypothetical protein